MLVGGEGRKGKGVEWRGISITWFNPHNSRDTASWLLTFQNITPVLVAEIDKMVHTSSQLSHKEYTQAL